MFLEQTSLPLCSVWETVGIQSCISAKKELLSGVCLCIQACLEVTPSGPACHSKVCKVDDLGLLMEEKSTLCTVKEWDPISFFMPKREGGGPLNAVLGPFHTSVLNQFQTSVFCINLKQ